MSSQRRTGRTASIRVAFALLWLFISLAAAATFIRAFVASDPGRRLLIELADGADIGSGVIRLKGLNGDPLGRFSLDSLVIEDSFGAWLTVNDIRLSWRPQALAAGDINVTDLTIGLIRLARNPGIEPPSGDGRAVDILVTSAAVSRFEIGRSVIGQPAAFALRGSGRTRQGEVIIETTAEALDGGGDRLNARIAWTRRAGLEAEASAFGQPDGPLSVLIGAPMGSETRLDLKLRGPLHALEGGGALRFGDRDALVATARRQGDLAEGSLSLFPASWPLVNRWILSDSPMRLSMASRMTNGTIDIDARLSSDDQNLDAHLSGALKDGRTLRPADLNVTVGRLDQYHPSVEGRMQVRSSIEVSAPGAFDAAASIDLDRARGGSVGMQRLRAEARIGLRGPLLTLDIREAEIQGGRLVSAPEATLASARLEAAGQLRLADGRLRVDRLFVTSDAATVSASGTVLDWGRQPKLAGAVVLPGLATAGLISKTTRIRWSLNRARADQPLTLTADARMTVDAATPARLRKLTGSSPRMTATVMIAPDASGRVASVVTATGIRVSADGTFSPSGALRMSINGRLLTPLAFDESTSLRAMAFGGSLVMASGQGQLDIDVQDVRANIADREIDGVSARIETALSARPSVAVTATAMIDGHPIDLNGVFAVSGDEIATEQLRAGYRGLRFNAGPARLSPEEVSAQFTVSGTPDPSLAIAGLSARGSISGRPDRFTATLETRITGLRVGTSVVDDIRLDTVIRDGRLTGNGAILASGDLGSDIKVKFDAFQDGRDWKASINAAGDVLGLPARTPTPATLIIRDDGAIEGDATLSMLNGEVTAYGRLEGSDPAIRLTARSLDIGPLAGRLGTNPMRGRIDADIDIASRQQLWNGDFRLALSDVSPENLEIGMFQASLDGTIANSRIKASGDLSGPGLLLKTETSLVIDPGRPGSGPRPTQGRPHTRLEAEGDAGALWRLLGPAGQTAGGRLSADITVSGPLLRPTFDGNARIEQGTFEHAESGIRLIDVRAGIALQDRDIRLRDFVARDLLGGKVSGSGVMRYGDDLAGSIDINLDNLRVLNRADRFAVASGVAAISATQEGVAVTGTLALSQARFSIEQPAEQRVPTLPSVRRINFPRQEGTRQTLGGERPVMLDLEVSAPRRITVFGRGADTEWGGEVRIRGPLRDPQLSGQIRLIRGQLDIAGERFRFNTGSLNLDGPLRSARISIDAEREASDLKAKVNVSGTPVSPRFSLSSEPALPQDEILAQILFNRAASQLSAIEAAQLAAALSQLASGQAGFDPVALVRSATGLDRVSLAASQEGATLFAGKYLADNVYVQLGAGANGDAGAQVEWEPDEDISISSTTRRNGETSLSVRWKRDY